MKTLLTQFVLVALFCIFVSQLAAQDRAVFYSEDFDILPTGWTLNGQFEIGHPTTAVNVCQSAHTASNVLGTVLNGNYAPNQLEVDNYALSPLVSCVGKSDTKLSYWSFSQFQGIGYDAGRLYINVNGAGWTLIDNVENHREEKWTKHYVDISSLADGHANIQFKFTFFSSVGGEWTGWNLDDFQLQTAAPFSGIKTIDPAGAGADNYTTFTDAIEDINLHGVTAAGLTVNVAPDNVYNEDIPPLVASGNSDIARIVFQRGGAGTNPLIVATGAENCEEDGGFSLWGASYVTIDRIDISSSSEYLEYGYYISSNDLLEGSQHVEISNCTITILTPSPHGIGICQRVLGHPLDEGGANSYNRYHDNTIQTQAGISLSNDHTLRPPDFPDLECEVYANHIFGYTEEPETDILTYMQGIHAHGCSQLDIYDNEIYRLYASVAGTGIDCYYGNASIHGNLVHDLKLISSTAGHYIAGIQIEECRVYNNMVRSIESTRDDGIDEISVRGIVAGWNSDIDFNTVLISGEAVVENNSAAIFIESRALSGYVRIRDNVLVNTMISAPSHGSHYCVIAPSNLYSYFYESYSNYNIYYTDGGSANVGKYGDVILHDIDDWQSLTFNDSQSYNLNPRLISNYNLHIATGIMTPVESRGSYSSGIYQITWVNDDRDGQARNASKPDIGADEGSFTALYYPPMPFSSFEPENLATGIFVNSTPLLAWYQAPSETPFSLPTYNYTYLSTDFALVSANDPSALVQGDGNSLDYFYVSPDNLEPLTTYYWRVIVGNPSDMQVSDVLSFTTGTEVVISTYPFEEGFEGTTFPPYAWVSAYNWTSDGGLNGNNLNYNSMGGWIPDTYADHVHSGLKAATSPGMMQPSYDWLITPSLLFPTTASPELGFWLYYNRGATNPTTFYVLAYSGGSWTTLATYNTGAQSTHYDAEIVIDLSAYAGETIKLAFVAGPESTFYPISIDDISIRVNYTGYYTYTGFIPSGATGLELTAFTLEDYDIDLLEIDTGTTSTEDRDVSMDFTAGDSPHPVPDASMIGFSCSGSIDDPSLTEMLIHFEYQGERLTHVYQWNTALSDWVDLVLLVNLYDAGTSSGSLSFYLDLGPDYRTRSTLFEFITTKAAAFSIGIPSNVQVEHLGQDSFTLSWDSAEYSTGYHIYSSDNPFSGWELLAEVNPNVHYWYLNSEDTSKRFYKVANIWESR